MNHLADFLSETLLSEFEEMAVLKTSERGSVTLLRHRGSRKKYICRRFTGSAEAYRRLIPVSNPHLPRCYEAVQNQETAVVLEEYVTGDTLTEILRGGPLSAKTARAFMLQICDAVYTLHKLGLIHRDIKPDNVIISGDHLWLIDLDAARRSDPSKEKDTHILGTVGYAPPEQFGISRTDQRSDIYALGVLLNEMLTLEHPSVRLAPGRLGRIVRRCTMTSADQRYPDVRTLIRAL